MKLASSPARNSSITTRQPAVAEGVAGEHVGHRRLGLRQGPGDDHALAGSEAVGLDDDRRAALAQVGQRRLELAEGGVGCRGNVVPGEEGLAEGLGTLELCCAGAGTEAAQALRFEVIDHACHERRFRAHDRQADVLAAHEIRERVEIHRVDGHVLHARIEGRAGIARGDVDAADARRARGLPGQSVFPATAAEYQDLHRRAARLSGGSAACR
jgi:hypothetical protein